MLKSMRKIVKFIDLFAGIGGTRIGFENACKKNDFQPRCVFTSEIKPHAVKAYKNYFHDDKIAGDITQIAAKDIPDFDFLLAGFPCQPFSAAGSRNGFADTRGTLFFEIERILKEKRPYGFLLENVEGLVNHDRVNRKDKIGRTLSTIILKLESLGYLVTWKVIDSSKHGIPQQRKRIYIVGTKNKKISLDNFPETEKKIGSILETGLAPWESDFTSRLLSYFKAEDLFGKSIKDKRGGSDNIHSWDIGLKGETTPIQREILNDLLKERRKKHWAEKKQIKWMDGMPLTLDEIFSFFHKIPKDTLKKELDDLVSKKYLRFEHPKDIIESTNHLGQVISKRQQNPHKEAGYNIVAGKLSYPISKILSPHGKSPTLVATDVDKLAVVDSGKLRKLSIREGLRLFGFPDKFNLDLDYHEAFDLLGNTVVVPIVEMVSERIVCS